jgi:hypothetical protein
MSVGRQEHYEDYQRVVMANAHKWSDTNRGTNDTTTAIPLLVVLDGTKGARYAFRPCETMVPGLYKCYGDEPFVLLVDMEGEKCKGDAGRSWCRMRGAVEFLQGSGGSGGSGGSEGSWDAVSAASYALVGRLFHRVQYLLWREGSRGAVEMASPEVVMQQVTTAMVQLQGGGVEGCSTLVRRSEGMRLDMEGQKLGICGVQGAGVGAAVHSGDAALDDAALEAALFNVTAEEYIIIEGGNSSGTHDSCGPVGGGLCGRVRSDEVLFMFFDTVQYDFHYLRVQVLASLDTWARHFPHIFLSIEDTPLSRFAYRNCKTTHPNLFKCMGRAHPYVVLVACSGHYSGEPGPCCKFDKSVTFLMDEIPQLYTEGWYGHEGNKGRGWKYFIYGDDDVYYRPAPFMDYLARLDPSAMQICATGHLIPGVWGHQECNQVMQGTNWYGPLAIFTRAGIEHVQVGVRAGGLQQLCQGFSLMHDVGLSIFTWMYEVPKCQIIQFTQWDKILPDTMLVHAVKPRPYGDEEPKGCGFTCKGARHSREDWMDMYDMQQYFNEEHPSSAVVHAAEMKTLYLTGYNTTKHSHRHSIRREWAPFTPGDCQDPTAAPTPAPPTPVPPPTPTRIVNFGVGVAAGASGAEVDATWGVDALLATEAAQVQAGEGTEHSVVLPHVGGSKMILSSDKRLLGPTDVNYNETMVEQHRWVIVHLGPLGPPGRYRSIQPLMLNAAIIADAHPGMSGAMVFANIFEISEATGSKDSKSSKLYSPSYKYRPLINKGWDTFKYHTAKVYHEYDFEQVPLSKVLLPNKYGDDEPMRLDPSKQYAVGIGVNHDDHKVLVAQLADCNTRTYRALTASDGGLFGDTQEALGGTTQLMLDTKPKTRTGSCPLIYLTAKAELAIGVAP